jgi:hypothetical protein
MTQLWTILNGSGEVVQACCATPDPDTPPNECGEPWAAGYQAIAITEPPDLHRHQWNGSAWVLKREVAASIRWGAEKKHYATIVNGGFDLDGVGRVQTDADSREAITFLYNRARKEIDAGNPGWTASFKNEANEPVQLPAAGVVAVYEALGDFLGDCFTAKEAVWAAITAALADPESTGEEILAIPIPADYP